MSFAYPPAYDALLTEICVGLGFCGAVVEGKPLHVDQFVPENGTVRADDFVDWVFLAEGFSPKESKHSKFRTQLRDAFVRHMGGEKVDAREFR